MNSHGQMLNNMRDSPSEFTNSAVDLKIPIKYAYQKNKYQKPRRNKSAFILFSTDERNKLKLDQSGLNSNEIMVKLAENWKNLSPEEREKYNAKAREDKERYQRELIDFNKVHPNETIHNKTKNNHVKKPCSAYGIFLRRRKDIIKEQQPKLKMADVLKIVSREWKTLTQEEKKVYQDEANLEKEAARNKLCEATMRDHASKTGTLLTQDKIKKKQTKKDNNKGINIKKEDSPLVNNKISGINPEAWIPNLEDCAPPLSLTTEISDIHLKAEVPTQESKHNILQLLPTTSLDLILNPSLYMKKQESGNDGGLLSLLTVQKQSDLLADLLNFDKIPSLNFFDTTSFLKENRNSISQFLNISQPKAAPSKSKCLNETLVSLLEEPPSDKKNFQ